MGRLVSEISVGVGTSMYGRDMLEMLLQCESQIGVRVGNLPLQVSRSQREAVVTSVHCSACAHARTHA